MFRRMWCFLVAAFCVVALTGAVAQETSPPPGGETRPARAEPTPPVEKPVVTTQPTPAPTGEKILVNVKEVKGTVDVQPAGKDAWVPAVVGMRFSEGSKVCTGFQSAVLLEFGDTSVVLLKDLTQVTVDRLFKQENAVEAKMSMEVGRAKVFVKKQKIRTDFRVSTPRLTAAVKGTVVGIETSPDYGDKVSGYTGDTELVNELQDLLNVGEGDSTDDALLDPLDNIVLNDIIGLSPDGTASYESQGELANALEQEVALVASDTGTDVGQPALDNEMAEQSDLPTYGSTQFLTELDVLSRLGYSNLSSYLLNGGNVNLALYDVSSFQSQYGVWSAKDIWMRNLVSSSSYGPALMEAYGNGE